MTAEPNMAAGEQLRRVERGMKKLIENVRLTSIEALCGRSISVRLPFELNDEQVDAKFSNGVLAIRLPKPSDLQRPSRGIQVQSG
ncbi:MAG: Hsp20/alpha crystallin family protein [Alphaproteobacteria bacterium]|nr:Hsp20/alpha crystallin family protein [Alphaproteobacteria bacterium]